MPSGDADSILTELGVTLKETMVATVRNVITG